jgi:hypothetical protein
MPPQQSNRPLDVFDQLFGFGAHVRFPDRPGCNGCAVAAQRLSPEPPLAAVLDTWPVRVDVPPSDRTACASLARQNIVLLLTGFSGIG